MSLPLGRWTNFLGTLGRLRRNRRQRQAAASRRRTAVRRHALQILEERVVLNADPVAEDDFLRIEPGQSVEISTAQLMANDTDADGDPLSPAAHSFKTAQGVIVSFDAQGHFVYHAPTGFVGTDTFKYWVDDGQAMSEAATVRIRVGNHAPTAVADEFTVVTGETLHFDEATLMADDTDADGDPLEFAGLRTPTAHGSLTWHADGSFDYVSDAGYVGLDTFQYQITDGEAISYGNVTIHVVAPNLAPTAGDDPLGDVYQGYSASGNVLANDTDPESNALSVEAFDGPVTGGHLMLQSNGAFIFTADAGYLGAGSFAYTVHDTAGNSAAATISWNVVPAPNLAPTGVNDDVGNVVQGQSAGGNVLANDTDPENDALSVDYFGGYVTGGYLTLQTNGDYSFTADGYSVGGGGYTYTLHDSAGNTSTATLSWNVVAPPNLAPTPQNDSMGDVVLGQTATGNLLSNDTDPENNALTVDTYGGPVYGGWLTINANGDYSYTAQGTLGAGSFGYTVRDTAGNSAGATLSWNVAAPNGAPTGVDDDTGDVTQGQQTTGNVLANDSDPENDALSVDYYVGLVSGGYLTLQTNGDYTFAADGTYLGAGSHTYTLHDSAGNTSTATLSWNVVAPPNQAPTAAADSFWVEIKSNNNDPFAFTAPGLLANDTDPENNTLSVVEQVDLATSGGGRVTLHADGSFDYTPPPAPFLGDDTFSYTVVDQHGAQAVGQVTVNVRPPAPPSIALYGGGLAEEGQKVTLVPVMLAYPFASYSYSMDWGDGHVDSGTAGNGTPAPTTFEHTYVDDDPTGTPFDIYGATLTVTDAYGQSMTTGSPTVVSNVAPTIVVNPYQAEINEGAGTVTVSGSVYDQGLNDQIHVRIVGENSVVLFDQIVAPGGTFEFSFTPDDDDFDPNDDSEDGSSADFNFTISAMDDDNGYAQDFNGHITVNNVDPQNVTGGDLGIYFCDEPEPTDDEIEAMVTAEDPGSDDLIASAGARTLVNFYFDTYGFYEEYSVTVSVKDDDSSPAVETEVTYVVVHLIEWRLASEEKVGEYDGDRSYEINWNVVDDEYDLDEVGLVVNPGSILTNDSATVAVTYTHYEAWLEHWELVVVCDGTVIDTKNEIASHDTEESEEPVAATLTAAKDQPPVFAKAAPAWDVASGGTFTYEQDIETYDGPLDDGFTATITAEFEGQTWTATNWVQLNAPDDEPEVEVDLDTDSNNDGLIDDVDDGIEEDAPGRKFKADTGSAEIIVQAPENMPQGGVMRLYYDDSMFEIYSGGNYIDPGDEVSAGTFYARAAQAGSGLVTLSYTPTEGEASDDTVMLTAEELEVDLDTDSNNSGAIDETDDPIEEDEPGRKLKVGGEMAELKIGEFELPEGDVLRLYYDDGIFEIYSDAAGTVLVNPGDEVNAGSTVYARALAVGSALVTLSYTPTEGEAKDDKVMLTAEEEVDLDTDSNNNGAINITDDPIEEGEPGRKLQVGGALAELQIREFQLPAGGVLRLYYDDVLFEIYSDPAGTDLIDPGDEVTPATSVYARALIAGSDLVTLSYTPIEGVASEDKVRLTAEEPDVDLDTDSNNDGTINEVDDPIEEDEPGREIWVGDPLAQMQIGQIELPTGATLKLYFDPFMFEVYKAEDMLDPVLDGGEVEPGYVYVRGLHAGTGMITLTYTNGEETEDDKVRFTIYEAKIDLDTDSNNDGAIDDTDDAIEENPPGRIITINLDDDNNDGLPDMSNTGPVAGEDDLAELIIGQDVTPGAVLRIEFDETMFRLYKNDDKSDRIQSGAQVEPGVSVYAEAIAYGRSSVVLREMRDNEPTSREDTVLLSCYGVDLVLDGVTDTEYRYGAFVNVNSDYTKPDGESPFGPIPSLEADNERDDADPLYGLSYMRGEILVAGSIPTDVFLTLTFNETNIAVWRRDSNNELVRVYSGVAFTPDKYILKNAGNEYPYAVEIFTEGLSRSGQTATMSVDISPTTESPAADTADAKYTVVDFRASVDGNRSGTIDFTSRGDHEMYFWYNSDNDGYDEDGLLSDLRNSAIQDASDADVANARDLEDFAPLHIQLDETIYNAMLTAPASDRPRLAFRLTDLAGNATDVRLNLFRTSSRYDKALDYITEEADLDLLANRNHRTLEINSEFTFLEIDDYDFIEGFQGGGVRMPNGLYDVSFRFEAVAPPGLEDRDVILQVFLDMPNPSYVHTGFHILHQVDLHFKKAESFFDTYRVAPTAEQLLQVDFATHDDQYFADAAAPTTLSTIPSQLGHLALETVVLVHGWNMPTFWKNAFATTMYKRMFWHGFEGSFVSFEWPTMADEDGPWSGDISFMNQTYSPSEYQALRSGRALANLLSDLESQGHTVTLLAHSMGNIVSSEAFRYWNEHNPSEQLVDNYVAMESAMTASAYGSDSQGAQLPGLPAIDTNRQFWRSPANGVLNLNTPYYLQGTEFAAGNWVNMYNQSDMATSMAWTVNNAHVGDALRPGEMWPHFYINILGEGHPSAIPGSPYIYFRKPDAASMTRTPMNNTTTLFELLAFQAQAGAMPVGTQAMGNIGDRQWNDIDATQFFNGYPASERAQHSFQFHYSATATSEFYQSIFTSTGLTSSRTS